MIPADPRGAAWKYHTALGWPVVPVKRGEKRPAVAWETYQEGHPSPEEMEAWWPAGSANGVGLVTGKLAGVVVVDVDGNQGEESIRRLNLPRTPTARTARGRHFYFRHPGRPVQTAAGILPGVDVRGDGGFVVLPPTVHPSGTQYAWELEPGAVEFAPYPAKLEISTKPQRQPLQIAERIRDGARNDTLTRLAGHLRRPGASQQAIEAALLEENKIRCDPPLPDDEVVRIARSVARYAPAEELRAGGNDNDETFRLVPLDWDQLVANGLPEISYIDEPYIPASARIWATGPAESGKSIYALWLACRLSGQGYNVVYVSQENPFAEDVRRLRRLQPGWKHLRFFHDQGLDLSDPAHVAALIEAAQGCVLVILDTLTACWSGDEEDNHEIAAFDREVMVRVIRETGASVLVLDHTGHEQKFANRRGVSAPRGASSKGQKADTVLEFRAKALAEFTIGHEKNRMGGHKEPKRRFRVVDTEDDGLDIEIVEELPGAKAEAMADAMVEAIDRAGFLTTNALREAIKGLGGQEIQREAMELLRAEDPPRVRADFEAIDTGRGRQRAKVWRPVGATLIDS